jgi:glucosamine 6-phosphate synthetase-like amidotransferase/phosphosugar isomerase protein
MCGVFGFVAKTDLDKPNVEALARIARVTSTRGRHAWGMAWIDRRGTLRMFKQTGPITDHLGLLRLACDATLLIGHCRYATQGAFEENVNNHPHPCDGGWFVHNGIIPDYESIIREHKLFPNSDCDSEVLGLLVEKFGGVGGEGLCERIEKAVSCTRGPLVMLGLWKPGEIVAVRRGNPLHFSETNEGTYIASLPEGMPGKAESAGDKCYYHFQNE